jgi:hypothetical protein
LAILEKANLFSLFRRFLLKMFENVINYLVLTVGTEGLRANIARQAFSRIWYTVTQGIMEMGLSKCKCSVADPVPF